MWRFFHCKVVGRVETAVRRHLSKTLDPSLIVKSIVAVREAEFLCQNCAKKPKTILVKTIYRSKGRAPESAKDFYCCRVCNNVKEVPNPQGAKQ